MLTAAANKKADRVLQRFIKTCSFELFGLLNFTLGKRLKIWRQLESAPDFKKQLKQKQFLKI